MMCIGMNNQPTPAYVELSDLHASSYESTRGLIIHSNAHHPKHVHHIMKINQAFSFFSVQH